MLFKDCKSFIGYIFFIGEGGGGRGLGVKDK